MKNSELLRMFAEANKRCGYDQQAKKLEEVAVVYEAEEILKDEHKD